jgi:UDP-GlcNAc:undecaprenyl-phosphate/decaprenyl-phosphate GlcNAc-1-phosphate transferase
MRIGAESRSADGRTAVRPGPRARIRPGGLPDLSAPMAVTEVDAVLAGAAAAVTTALLTPPAARLARRVGAVDAPRERGLAERETPLLGGLAILAGVLLAAWVWIPHGGTLQPILLGAVVVTAVGAVDDLVDLNPLLKLLGQLGAVLIPVTQGVVVDTFTVPFVGRVDLGELGAPLTVVAMVGLINVVNFSDGVDGLAAGVCAIASSAFAVIAFDLGKADAAVLAAIVTGAALGFLVHNFHPAAVFMGDCGSNLLGYLLGCVIVEGTLKTNALIALVGPLVVLVVPFLDTGFVIAKRIKYGRPIYRADRWHFHHRMANIGFSQRRTVLYLYAWMVLMAGIAVALRFVPYSESSGRLRAGWALLMGGMLLVALAGSVYLVYVLEIFKFKRLTARRMRRARPDATDDEVDADVAERLETGEWETVPR